MHLHIPWLVRLDCEIGWSFKIRSTQKISCYSAVICSRHICQQWLFSTDHKIECRLRNEPFSSSLILPVVQTYCCHGPFAKMKDSLLNLTQNIMLQVNLFSWLVDVQSRLSMRLSVLQMSGHDNDGWSANSMAPDSSSNLLSWDRHLKKNMASQW